MPANLENSAVATGLERSVFIPISKEGNAKECSNYRTIALTVAAPKAAAEAPAGGKKVVSPLPGSIIKVLVAEGQAVKKGDTLLTLESMKMENTVAAECDGTVTKVAVTAGQTVMQDDLLVVIG